MALCPRLESSTEYLGKLPDDQFQDAAGRCSGENDRQVKSGKAGSLLHSLLTDLESGRHQLLKLSGQDHKPAPIVMATNTRMERESRSAI
jgi:hypothetical protein